MVTPSKNPQKETQTTTMSDNPGKAAKATNLTKSGHTSKPSLKSKAAEVNSLILDKLKKKKRLTTTTTTSKAKDKNNKIKDKKKDCKSDVLKLNIHEDMSMTLHFH